MTTPKTEPICPRCGHVDLRGAPALALVMRELLAREPFALSAREVATATKLSLTNTINHLNRLTRLGLAEGAGERATHVHSPFARRKVGTRVGGTERLWRVRLGAHGGVTLNGRGRDA